MFRLTGKLFALGLAVTLVSCDVSEPPDVTPAQRPDAIEPAQEQTRSLRSEELVRYYARLQADLVAQGLLRTDGGGPDTPYTADQLVRNFEEIAFFDEYAEGAGLAKPVSRDTGTLRRWTSPVRVDISFGSSIPQSRKSEDKAAVSNYVARLARVTGHSISMSQRGNFHVLFMGEDDKKQLEEVLRAKVPNISNRTVDVITRLPRSIHCLVVAFSGTSTPHTYSRAVALIRAEHPDLIRLSCIHEELSQGLGLANDSPDARPSIFNDDDEFALLTSHDEKLLSMLYDPRLDVGLDADSARPILRILAREQMGQDL